MSDPVLIAMVAAVAVIAVAFVLKQKRALTFSEVNAGKHCECKSCTLANSCSKFIGK